MKGHVYKRGETWSYVVDIGVIDGKRKQKTKGGYKLKREAEKALTDILSDMQNTGVIFEVKKISFSELYNEFLIKECGFSRKSGTLTKYDSMYRNHIKNLLGHKFIANISGDDVTNYFNKMRETHSTSYIKSINNFLVVIFGYALKKKYLKSSPMQEVPTIRVPSSEVVVYSQNDLRRIFDRLSGTNLQLAFFIALNTGMRAGEVFGLTWDAIDFEKKLIRIDKQMQVVEKKWSFVVPKTETSDRVIDMNVVLENYLSEEKKRQDENRFELQGYYRDDKVIDLRFGKEEIKQPAFVNRKSDGEMLNTYSDKYIARVAKEMGIAFKFHNLRDTHASMLLDQGYSINYVSSRLGHARVSITWDTYSHLLPDKEIKLDRLDSSLSFMLT